MKPIMAVGYPCNRSSWEWRHLLFLQLGWVQYLIEYRRLLSYHQKYPQLLYCLPPSLRTAIHCFQSISRGIYEDILTDVGLINEVAWRVIRYGCTYLRNGKRSWGRNWFSLLYHHFIISATGATASAILWPLLNIGINDYPNWPVGYGLHPAVPYLS